MTLKERT